MEAIITFSSFTDLCNFLQVRNILIISNSDKDVTAYIKDNIAVTDTFSKGDFNNFFENLKEKHKLFTKIN